MKLKYLQLNLICASTVLLAGCAATQDLLKKNDIGNDSAAVNIYFTRHAEKQTQQKNGEDVCGESKCAEELSAAGLKRADMLAQWFGNEDITGNLTHIYSSHKLRTLQTIAPIAKNSGLNGDKDKNPDDGVQELPISNDDGEFATELSPESTGPSVSLAINALNAIPDGSVALVAGHSGTLYKIMHGLGLEDACAPDNAEGCNEERYPIDDKGKVANFGDIWHVRLTSDGATFMSRVNLQPQGDELAIIEEVN